MSATLMCGSLCLAFSFNNKRIYWLWADNKPVAIILAIAAIVLGIFWLKMSKKVKIESKM